MENGHRMEDHPILEVERGPRVEFHYNGKAITGYEGETVAAALFAAGIRIFSRSFKYHRPRGLFCMSGHCSNCLMRVDGVPNVRTCTEQVRSGMRVESQNAWPSLEFDLAAVTGWLDFLVRPGFQYRRFIRPRWAYHIWEKFLRRMAGIGSLADVKSPAPAKRMPATPEIVVVGGGTAGLSAALHAAQAGAEVLLVERENILGGRGLYDTTVIQSPQNQTRTHRSSYTLRLAQKVEKMASVEVLKDATAFAWYDEGILAVSRPAEFWEITPGRVIIATGSYETPMLFENNDLPGIFLAGGLQRLMHRFYMRPGKNAVVVTYNDEGYAVAQQLLDAGVTVVGIVDDRSDKEIFSSPNADKLKQTGISVYSGQTITAATGRKQLNGVVLSQTKLVCDVLCIAGVRTPANELVFQRTCEGVYILESQNQFTRKPVTDTHMRVDADMFVAGGASGAQGLNRAWLEGKVAGLSAALDLGHGNEEAEAEREEAINKLTIPTHQRG